jgi:RNA polymerase sigma-70 factor (ECF subfamily)
MRWSVRTIRSAGRSAGRGAGDSGLDGEAALGPLAGMGGVDLAGGGLVGAGFSEMAGQPGGRPGGTKPGAHPAAASFNGDGAGDAGEGADSATETDSRAQPSGGDGVEKDMATLVLDNPAMGTGAARRMDAKPGALRGVNHAADESSDAAIMLRVAAGDEAGFNYLVGKYHRAMIHFLFRMVRNQAVAEELAQEVFLRVYRSRESYRAEAKFTTWLYRIATNLAVNQARDTRHERTASTVYLDTPDAETGTTPDVADDEPTVEERLLREERMQAIRTHVMALPERQRMAVLMHKYQGMDYRQIGEVLKLSESATKSLLFRAYQTLRDKLKDFV